MKVQNNAPVTQSIDSKISQARQAVNQKQDSLSSLAQKAMEKNNFFLYGLSWAGEKCLMALGYLIDRFKRTFSCLFTPNVTLAEVDDEEAVLAPAEEPVNTVASPKSPVSILSPGAKKERDAEVNHTVLEFDTRQKKKLDELLEVLDRNDAFWLRNNAASIMERAKSLRLCNPFETIRHTVQAKNHLSGKDNLAHLRNIPNKWFGGSRVWEACVKIFAGGLEKYRADNLIEFEKELEAFFGEEAASVKEIINDPLKEGWQNWDLVFKKLIAKK